MHAHHMLHDGSIVPSYAKIGGNGGIQQGLEVKSNFDQRYVGCDLKDYGMEILIKKGSFQTAQLFGNYQNL